MAGVRRGRVGYGLVLLGMAVFIRAVTGLHAEEAGEATPKPGIEPARKANGQETRRWLELCWGHAKDYEISPEARPDRKFRLLPDPLFGHAAPSRGSDDIGAVYLWVDTDARPAVIGTVFGWSIGGGFRGFTHEFHSLDSGPITGVWRQKDRWKTSGPGLTWKSAPEASTPATAVALRVRQMRDLAQRFQAYSIDQKGGRWELRLIPRPVYQYELKDQTSALGGALFLFCLDTNTDVILALEARRSGDNLRWHYGCASFADWELHVQFDRTEVWSDPAYWQAARSSHDLHWVRRVEDARLPEPSAGGSSR